MGSTSALTTYEYSHSSRKGSRTYYYYFQVESVANIVLESVTSNNAEDTHFPDCSVYFNLSSSLTSSTSKSNTRLGSSLKNTRYIISQIYLHEGSYDGPIVQTCTPAPNAVSVAAVLSTGGTINRSFRTEHVSKPFGNSKTYYLTCRFSYVSARMTDEETAVIDNVPIGELVLQPRLTTRIFYNKNHPVSDSNVHTDANAGIRDVGYIVRDASYFTNIFDTTNEYKFTGWYLDAACTQPVVYPYTVPEASPVNLYAGWKLNAGPTIKVKANGEWKEGELKAKVNGEWVDAEAAYVKVDGAWIEIN